RIGGRDFWVLFQAFERRILTYNPSTPDPLWRVEMGNVGQHYKDWRPEPLVASPLQGVRVVQSSPDPTSDVCFGDGAIDGSCPPGQLVTLPRSFLTTLRSENSWARTKPSGWMLLHSDNAIYDMQSSAMLVFKRIDNSVDSVQQQGGQVDYLHGLKRRIEVETGVGFVTTYGTLFSIILPSAVQAVGEQLRIVVPRGRGSVTLQPPSPGSGLSPPAPIVVQSGQVLIAIKNQSVSYSIRSTNPSEEQYAADKLNRLGSIPGLEELTWLGAGEAGMPPPPTVTRTPIPTSSTGTPTPTSIPTPGTITPSPTMPPQTCSTLYGSITNSDPVQIGRLTSSLIPSPCNVYGLPCLGIVDTNARHYKRYNFHFPFGSFSTQCITVRIDATGCPGNLFSAAYITDFDGNNICTNLHGATGDVVSDSASYQFVVYRGYDFSIVVHEASPNSGCSNYALTISTDTACNNIITGAATPTRTSTPTAPPQSPTRTPTSLTPPGAGR
ncbi:MAG TPA: hypothetical protein VEX13_11020, partial [Chloroflexia bacterium]|nr:hypothetical protein [Chloroflexia bacterium]